MGKTLLVAEKPSVARDIARVLGVRSKCEGYLESDDMIITWAVGHLVRLCEPNELDESYKRWSLSSLPIIPGEWKLAPISKTRSQLTVVKRLMKQKDVDSLICATDAGREGELIFRWIYETAGCKKPVKRLWISSMTDEAIREGMAALKPDSDYEPLYQSALCRAKADWLIGMNMSRAFSLKHDVLLSIGRVQTPTLALLVERKKQIDDFKPQTLYSAEADFGKYKGTYFNPEIKNEAEASMLKTRAEAEAIVSEVKGKTGIVRRVERTTVKEAPPRLFDLTTLQREANRRCGFTAKKTLSLAQSLYETHKLITYPRTDSRLLPFDVKPKLQKVIETMPPPYAAFAATALTGMQTNDGGRIFRKDIGSDHHAIIPTGRKIDMGRLKPDEQKLMDMIARRVLSAFYPAYEAAKQTIITDVEGKLFKSTQKDHSVIGWKEVEGKREPIPPLPDVKPNEQYNVVKASVEEHVSKPPQPYTDASILQAMEHAGKLVEDESLKEIMKRHGLGTPATRAAILERLIEVGYAERKGKSLLPTNKGCKLITCVPPMLASAELTGKWEYGLNLIAEQKQFDEAFAARFIDGVERMTRDIVADVKEKPAEQIFSPEESKAKRGRGGSSRKRSASTLDAVCPVCGKSKITENEKAFGCSEWRKGCPMTIWKDALAKHGGPVLTRVIIERLIKDGVVRGSTGTITLNGGQMRFLFKDSADATPPVGIVYNKKKQ